MEEKRKERYESSLEKKQKKTDVKKDEKKEDKNTEHSIAIAEKKIKKQFRQYIVTIVITMNIL